MASYIKTRHKVCFALARPIGWIIAKIYHFKYKIFPLKKGEQYFILSNHQTLLDPLFACLSFKAPVYIVASDTLFNTSLKSKMMVGAFAPIKKRKATADVKFVLQCVKIAKEGGNILMFPEGNRAWADFQFHVSPSICKMVRMLKIPLCLYNFSGGYGVDPRWSLKLRKGNFYGAVKEVISVEDINAMSDDELYTRIINGLKIIDSNSGEIFKSNRRAECLERQLFVCPKCNQISTLTSKGNYVTCLKCGLKVEYTEKLTLSSSDTDFKMQKLVEWYKYQVQWVKNYQVKPNEIIFSDDGAKLFDKTTTKVKQLAKGKLILNDKALLVDDCEIELSKIISYTIVGGCNLIVNTSDKSYSIKAGKRFNALKYALIFNILLNKEDEYYGLNV